MYQIKEAALKIKDKILGSSLEKSLEDVTSNSENLNVPTRVLQEIADYTYSEPDLDIILKHLWFQFLSSSDKWRKVQKTLNLVDYLIKNGSPHFAEKIKEEIYQIRTLARFEYEENGHDRGLPIREKSIEIDKLLEDKQSIEEERKKADVVRQKLKSLRIIGPESNKTPSGSVSSTGRYEGFSSKDSNIFLGSKDSNNQKGPESDNKENVNTNTNDEGFIYRQNTKYAVPHKSVQEENTQSQQLVDLLGFITGVPVTAENKGILDSGVFLGTNDSNGNKVGNIWKWDQQVYNRLSTSEINDDPFDWSQVPETKNDDVQNKQLLSNLHNCSQENLAPESPNRDGSNNMFAPLATAPATEKIEFGRDITNNIRSSQNSSAGMSQIWNFSGSYTKKPSDLENFGIELTNNTEKNLNSVF